MATYVMCSVKDLVADQFGRPFFAVSDGSAIRGFADEVNSADSMLAKHPADFQLFHMGVFDDESGEIFAESPYRLLISGPQCFNRPE